MLNIDIKLPQILGLTASPFKKKIEGSVLNEAQNALTKICENLNSSILIDPDLIGSTSIYKEKSSNDQYIESVSHLNEETNIEEIETIIYNFLFPILNAILKNNPLLAEEFLRAGIDFDLNKFKLVIFFSWENRKVYLI